MFFLLRLAAGFLLTAILLLFVMLNRTDIAILWNPLGDDAIVIPVYMLGLGGVLIGSIFGGVTAWMNMANVRKDRRRLKREVKNLEKEMARLQDNKFTPASAVPATDILPAVQVRKAS